MLVKFKGLMPAFVSFLLVFAVLLLLQITAMAQKDEGAPVDGVRINNAAGQAVIFFLKKDTDADWKRQQPLESGGSEPYLNRNQIKIVQNDGTTPSYPIPINFVYKIFLDNGRLGICQISPDKSSCTIINPN